MPAASIAICTKDRKQELRAALSSAFEQQGDIEVLVYDDGSSDGTSELVAQEFPQACLLRGEASIGPTGGRNRLFEEARAPVVLCLDDDAIFGSPTVVRETLHDFEHPRVGGVAIPMIDRPRSRIVHRAPDRDGLYVMVDYFAAACAYRRDVFFAAGGFTESFGRAAEEPDLAERMLRLGYVMRLGTGESVVDHQELPRREWEPIWWHQQRNEVVLSWRSAPAVYLPARLAKLAVDAVRLGWGVRHLPLFVRGYAAGLRMAVRTGDRRPLPIALYRKFAHMRSAPLPLAEIESLLPPLRASEQGSAS